MSTFRYLLPLTINYFMKLRIPDLFLTSEELNQYKMSICMRRCGVIILACMMRIRCVTCVDAASDLARQRHNRPPIQKHAQIMYPVSHESEYMLSPCKPESDGYFGSTSGVATVLQYGFEMESSRNTVNIGDALDTIGEYVIDTIVSSTFPSVCNYRNLEGNTTMMMLAGVKGITGYNFGVDYDAIRKY
jgi:hypothetical protein